MRRALVICALAVCAFAIGRLSAPGAGEPASSLSSSEQAGGYAHSPAGAALAAARYQQAFADPSILQPGVLRRRIEAVATPDFARAMLAANQPGTARLAAGPLGIGIRYGVRTAYFAVPLSHRLLSYSPRRARVLTWGFTVLGNAAAIEPTAYFGTARTDLAWRDGEWKISYTRSAFGPTPRLGTPRKGGEGFELIELARDMQPYGIAP